MPTQLNVCLTKCVAPTRSNTVLSDALVSPSCSSRRQHESKQKAILHAPQLTFSGTCSNHRVLMPSASTPFTRTCRRCNISGEFTTFSVSSVSVRGHSGVLAAPASRPCTSMTHSTVSSLRKRFKLIAISRHAVGSFLVSSAMGATLHDRYTLNGTYSTRPSQTCIFHFFASGDAAAAAAAARGVPDLRSATGACVTVAGACVTVTGAPMVGAPPTGVTAGVIAAPSSSSS